MKFGIMPQFERATICNGAWLKEFAQMVEAEGCESIWTVEHPVMAEDYEPLYEYSEDGRAPILPETVMPDPLELLAYFAGVTTTLNLGTSIVILPLHSPVIMAKRLATIDAISDGRLLFGAGLGWQREEYQSIGVPYEERGARMDECIEVMRVLWRDDPASYAGKYYKFERLFSDTKPKQEGGVPIIIGGSTTAAAKRAGRLGDGFYPYVISPDEFALRIAEMRAAAVEAGRDPDAIELTVWPGSYRHGSALDLGLATAYAEIGVTRLTIAAYESGASDIDGMRAFVRQYREQIIEKL